MNEHPSPVNHGWHIDIDIFLPARFMLPALLRCIPTEIREQQDSDTDSDVTSSDESCEMMITLVLVASTYKKLRTMI